MRIESLLKRNYKVYLITVVIFAVVAGIFFYTGSSYSGEKHFSGKLSMTIPNYFWYIFGSAIVMLIVLILVAMIRKIIRVNQFLSIYNVDEINLSLNSKNSVKCMEMSVYLTNKLLISTNYPHIVEISNIKTIQISAYNTSKITITIWLKNNKKIEFYTFITNSKNINKARIIKNEIYYLESGLRSNFPYIDVISDTTTNF